MKEIAERTRLPQPYLEQILLAVKGAGSCARSAASAAATCSRARPGEITLADIVAAVEGPQLPLAEHPDHCEGHCILQEVWVCVSDETRRYLEQVTLAELVERTMVGHPGAIGPVSPSVTLLQRSSGRGRASSAGSGSSNASDVAGYRMHEREVRGVQERARRRDRVALAAVGRVADDRMSDRGEMHADLMRAAGFERAARAGCTAASSYSRAHLVAGARRPALRREPPCAFVAPPSDRSARRSCRAALRE